MSAQSNIDTVRQTYAALAEGNAAAAMANFHESMVLNEPESLPYGGTYKGLSEVGAAIGTISKYVDLAGLKVGRVLADDDSAVAYVTAAWRNSDGTTREIPMRECYQFSDSKIIEMDVFYWDVAALVSN
jgi:ketosteroid isomerase-like protein